MSLFRKPKKIQRRVFTADDDDEDNNGEPEAPPPPLISRPKKEKPAKAATLLSFADEEENEGEVFKVRKSKQSSRLAKRREKEKKRGPDNDSNENSAEFDNNHVELNNSENSKPKKKVTLEGLILCGREALAADGAGDVSDDDGGSPPEEEDSRGFHCYRAESVRAALAAGGHIPDAALIHAARKTRQQARELGGDYIPIKPVESKPGSRLIRDDGSGDDDEDGRIEVRGLELPSDKPKRGTAIAPTNEELDSEPDEWEEQQIKKAMPALNEDMEHSILNPFASLPPAPVLEAAGHLRPLADIAAQPPATAKQLIQALRTRVEELHTDRARTSDRKQELQSRSMELSSARATAAARRAALDAAYRRAQAVRGYLTDLVECLDEKMPQLEALEARALALHRRRCEFVIERRRADVRDQAQDVMTMAARGSSSNAPKPQYEDEARTRRAAEREGRRRARRLARHAACVNNSNSTTTATHHRDGDSSDDELTPAEAQHYNAEREKIAAASASLFADALPAWRSVRGVCARVSRWRRADPVLYNDAYVADCLPKLLAPYVRHQLILWNPLADSDNEDYERMEWYRCVMMFGVKADAGSGSESDSDLDGEVTSGYIDRADTTNVTEQSVRDDPDLMLAPTLVAKVVIPKVTELIEHAWDPMCVRACIRLRQLLARWGTIPRTGPALGKAARAAHSRLHQAIMHDVYVPPLPPTLSEGPCGAFWRRCIGSGVRLVRATLALTPPPDLLRADKLVLTLLESLCCGAGCAPAVLACGAAAALADTLPRAGTLRAAALARLAALVQRTMHNLHSDNPMHLKALEQARAIIAESKAQE